MDSGIGAFSASWKSRLGFWKAGCLGHQVKAILHKASVLSCVRLKRILTEESDWWSLSACREAWGSQFPELFPQTWKGCSNGIGQPDNIINKCINVPISNFFALSGFLQLHCLDLGISLEQRRKGEQRFYLLHKVELVFPVPCFQKQSHVCTLISLLDIMADTFITSA